MDTWGDDILDFAIKLVKIGDFLHSRKI